MLAVENLIHNAETGVKISSADRRRCVGYLMSTQLGMSNVEMATKFGVSEKTIREDKKHVKEELISEMRGEDASAVAADLAYNFRRQLRDLEVSKQSCKLGTKDYLQHCTAILDIELKRMKALQDLGLLPKNLGNVSVETFEYAAIVLKGDQIDSRSIHAFDEVTQSKIRSNATKALPKTTDEKVIDAEYEPIPVRSVDYAESEHKEG